MKKALRLAVLFAALLVGVADAQAPGQFSLINTSAADFTLVTGVASQRIFVQGIDLQNVGTAKVTVQLCDGTCGTAANVKFKWDLSAATATNMGGGWSFRSDPPWAMTASNSLIAQVDTGATNNVRVTVTSFLR